MEKLSNEYELPMYLNLKEFRARVFPIAERTVWRMISTGNFPKPAARIGRKTAVWKREDLLAWIQKQEIKEQTHVSKNLSLERK